MWIVDNGEKLIKGHKTSVARSISPRDLAYSKVSIVINNIFNTWKLLK